MRPLKRIASIDSEQRKYFLRTMLIVVYDFGALLLHLTGIVFQQNSTENLCL